MEDKNDNINQEKLDTKIDKKTENKKPNIFIRFFKCVGRAIKTFFTFIFFCVLYVIIWPFTRCKIIGKDKLRDKDEARIFITNHYQLYGPLSIFMNFPYKSRQWIIDKMMDEKSVEQQMGLMVYNEFKKVPKFLKWIVLKIVKNLMVFCMKMAKGIPVSRENPRANIKAFQISTEALEKGNVIIIYPEKDYVNEGVGIFMQGFEHIGKYYFSKTGKRISFYPMFISQKNKTMYICDPIIYNPEENHNKEKERIILYLRNEMVAKYEKVEINAPKKKKKCKKTNDSDKIINNDIKENNKKEELK